MSQHLNTPKAVQDSLSHTVHYTEIYHFDQAALRISSSNSAIEKAIKLINIDIKALQKYMESKAKEGLRDE